MNGKMDKFIIKVPEDERPKIAAQFKAMTGREPTNEDIQRTYQIHISRTGGQQ